MIINTLKIPSIDSANEEMIIFISGFLDIILRGLNVRNNFNIDKPMSIVMSITAVITMKKSNFDQLLLR